MKAKIKTMRTLIFLTILSAFTFLFTFCAWVFYLTYPLAIAWMGSIISFCVLNLILFYKSESKPNPRDEDED